MRLIPAKPFYAITSTLQFGFDELAILTAKSPKSLMRMLSTHGNPQARNLFEIINHLQEREGLHFKVETMRSRKLTNAKNEGHGR